MAAGNVFLPAFLEHFNERFGVPAQKPENLHRSLHVKARKLCSMNAIDEYLRPERPSLAALQREVRPRFAERTLAVPNYRTVRRRAEAVDARTTRRDSFYAASAPIHSVRNLSTSKP